MHALPRPARCCAPAVNRVIRPAKSALQAMRKVMPKIVKRRRLKGMALSAVLALVPAE